MAPRMEPVGHVPDGRLVARQVVTREFVLRHTSRRLIRFDAFVLQFHSSVIGYQQRSD